MLISRSRIKSSIRDAAWKLLSPSWRTRSGIQVGINSYSEWVLFCDIFVDGEYDQALGRLVQILQPSLEKHVVVDLGSNVGFFMLRLFDKLRQAGMEQRVSVFAFEANHVVNAEARRRLALNEIDQHCHLNVGLVGSSSGAAQFKSAPNDHISSRLSRPGEGGQPMDFIDVETLLPKGSISLLKCDIEGAEELFINSYSALLRRTKLFLVEFHCDLCNVDACRSMLQRLGFEQYCVSLQLPNISVELYCRKD